jgi:hypothetical protein
MRWIQLAKYISRLVADTTNMKYLKVLIWVAALGTAENVIASDVFPSFVRNAIDFAVPTNTPGCLNDPSFLVGTNYVYKLNGQNFPASVNGHIQSTAEGFSGKTDESTPWKTLTELLAAYQNGSSENEIRALYDDASTNFLTMVYGNEQMKARFQAMGLSITAMQAVWGYDYAGGYLAQVRLSFKDGRREVSQYYFVLKGGRYKVSSLNIPKPDPSLMNIGLFLNKDRS